MVLYLGKVLPPAVIAMLIIYCLRNVSFSIPADWTSEAIPVRDVHLGAPARCRRGSGGAPPVETQQSSVHFGGTVLYMVLVQAVFV